MSRKIDYNISGVKIMAYILLGINCFLNSLNTLLQKKFQMGFKRDAIHFIIYNLIGAVFGSTYFFIASGFKLEMNGITFAFSAVYAALVFMSIIMPIYVMSKVPVSLMIITSSAGGILSSTIGGMIFFAEGMTIQKALAAILIITAVVLPYRKLIKTGFKKESILICLIFFINTTIGALIPKFYTVTEGVKSSISWFLMTNLIILVVCAIAVIFYSIRKHENIGKLLCILTPGQLGNLAVRTALSNVGSVLGVAIVARMAISVSSVISSSVGLVLGALMSAFVFKETLTKENKIGVVLAVVAVALAAL